MRLGYACDELRRVALLGRHVWAGAMDGMAAAKKSSWEARVALV